MAASEVADLIALMSMEQQGHIRGTATEIVLGLSANAAEARSFFGSNLPVLNALLQVTKDKRYPPVAKDAWLALVNVTSLNFEPIMEQLSRDGAIEAAIEVICDESGENADEACMALANLTRSKNAAVKLTTLKDPENRDIVSTICTIFGKGPAFNKKATYHYLGNVLFNVSQSADGRQQILKRKGEGCVFQRLLPFTTHMDSKIRRGGVIGCIRNCCFSTSDHKWLLSDEVNILPHLLLPLIGGEELDDDDMDGMPDELQYMDPDKEREPDCDLRKMLLETLSQLLTTQDGRETMRKKKVYPVLREYHKWETEEDVQEACETVVHVLITPEMEDAPSLKEKGGNLNDVQVPKDFVNAQENVNAEVDGKQLEQTKDEEQRVFQVGDHPPGYYLKNQADFQVTVGQ